MDVVLSVLALWFVVSLIFHMWASTALIGKLSFGGLLDATSWFIKKEPLLAVLMEFGLLAASYCIYLLIRIFV